MSEYTVESLINKIIETVNNDSEYIDKILSDCKNNVQGYANNIISLLPQSLDDDLAQSYKDLLDLILSTGDEFKNIRLIIYKIKSEIDKRSPSGQEKNRKYQEMKNEDLEEFYQIYKKTPKEYKTLLTPLGFVIPYKEGRPIIQTYEVQKHIIKRMKEDKINE